MCWPEWSSSPTAPDNAPTERTLCSTTIAATRSEQRAPAAVLVLRSRLGLAAQDAPGGNLAEQQRQLFDVLRMDEVERALVLSFARLVAQDADDRWALVADCALRIQDDEDVERVLEDRAEPRVLGAHWRVQDSGLSHHGTPPGAANMPGRRRLPAPRPRRRWPRVRTAASGVRATWSARSAESPRRRWRPVDPQVLHRSRRAPAACRTAVSRARID